MLVTIHQNRKAMFFMKGRFFEKNLWFLRDAYGIFNLQDDVLKCSTYTEQEINTDKVAKSPISVIPAQAGIQK